MKMLKTCLVLVLIFKHKLAAACFNSGSSESVCNEYFPISLNSILSCSLQTMSSSNFKVSTTKPKSNKQIGSHRFHSPRYEKYFAFRKFEWKIYLNRISMKTLKFRQSTNVKVPKSDGNFSEIYQNKLFDVKIFRYSKFYPENRNFSSVNTFKFANNLDT